MSEQIRKEVARLTGRGARGYACGVKVSGPVRVGGAGGACVLGCSFCGTVISGMCGPGGSGTVCQMCATAIRDEQHPLGRLLRDTWVQALREALRD